MQEKVIKVEYMFDGEHMSNQDYSDQDCKIFYITKEMIYDLVSNNIEVLEGFDICTDNFYVDKI